MKDIKHDSWDDLESDKNIVPCLDKINIHYKFIC
jgi:hypothetical protein